MDIIKSAFWITALSVSLTSIAVTSMITFYLFKRKEKVVLQKTHSAPQAEAAEQERKDFFDTVSFGCSGSIKRRKKTKKESRIHRRDVYPYLDCPPNSIFAENNKWINNTATHNTNHVEGITERKNALIVGICDVVIPGPKGEHFIIEDIYGRIVTEPAKFKPGITADELRGRLVVFEGYIENKKFTVKTVTVTKFEAA